MLRFTALAVIGVLFASAAMPGSTFAMTSASDPCNESEIRSVQVVARSTAAQSAVAPQALVTRTGDAWSIEVSGPLLGSMDSPTVETETRCTANGFVVMAQIVRSADFHGATRQNQTWIPVATLALPTGKMPTTLEFRWVMKSTLGKEIKQFTTPSEPRTVSLPIVLQTKIPPVR